MGVFMYECVYIHTPFKIKMTFQYKIEHAFPHPASTLPSPLTQISIFIATTTF